MAHDVFISYSTHDQKIVEGLSAYLEQNGVRCFVAYRDIPIGVVWAKAITEAIENCKIMIVVFSEHFNRSDQVDREIELCIEEGHPILTFRIQDTAFKGAKKFYLKNLNWIDAFPNPKDFFSGLCECTQKLLTSRLIQNNGAKIEHSINESNSIEYNRNLAEQGNADAQLSLGLMYANGRDTTQDYVSAFQWIEKSAIQENIDAQYLLGIMFEEGYGVKRDTLKAQMWYQKANLRGYTAAQRVLARIRINNKIK